jgi:glyoxalase family protein
MNPNLLGLHHVTAIASDPQRTLDFYTQVLGLRLVKLTVNFDDPTTYHFYFGDSMGSPGTILTFFPWPHAVRGQIGGGMTSAVGFSVPSGSLDHWADHLLSHAINVDSSTVRFGTRILEFSDPDGMAIELVDSAEAAIIDDSTTISVPQTFGITSLHSVTLLEDGYEATAELLTQELGYELIDQDGARYRFSLDKGVAGTILDIVCRPTARPGRLGAGSVHHIAFRTANDNEQLQWRQKIADLHLNVSPVMDRQYFHSIYFREPGGVLFEIATDPPGFATDETLDQLGTHLKLPAQYEAYRVEIELRLPKLIMPVAT